MTRNNWNENYFQYLTQKLDKNLSKNPVVGEVENLIKLITRQKETVNVLEIGCFTGSLIHRIYQNLNSKLKNKVKIVGIDSDFEALRRGVGIYPEITFIHGLLGKKLPLLSRYDIVVLSNILHEVYSENKNQSPKSKVNNAIKESVRLLNDCGYIVILDGIKSKNPQKKIILQTKNNLYFNKFIGFAKKYKALKIKAKVLGENQIESVIESLSAFLTKSRYMEESYWKQEANQLYQYFTETNFKKILSKLGMKIIKLELINFDKKEIEAQFSLIKPKIDFPPKNALIVAKILKRE